MRNISNEYGDVNWEYVKSNIPSMSKGHDAIEKVYEKAGMKNPKLYIERQMRTMYLMSKVASKYPEFRTAPPKERAQLVASEMSNQTVDVNKVLEVRKNKVKNSKK
jgi:hypothetical protein